MRVRTKAEGSTHKDGVLALGDRRVPLLFRKNRRARRIIVRLEHGTGAVVVVLPSRVSRDQGRRFALANEAWIRERLDRLPPPVALRPGALLPYRGTPHRLRHRPGVRGAVWRDGDEIHVAGRSEHAERRVHDWLRQEARRLLERSAWQKATSLGCRIARLSLRDPKSRWGSCSRAGALSFSWRLVLAPPEVLDYVVAHEVAHLREMNHGPRFWALARELSPHVDRARAWLRDHGQGLHRYGA